jgi:hypothetical protein
VPQEFWERVQARPVGVQTVLVGGQGSPRLQRTAGGPVRNEFEPRPKCRRQSASSTDPRRLYTTESRPRPNSSPPWDFPTCALLRNLASATRLSRGHSRPDGPPLVDPRLRLPRGPGAPVRNLDRSLKPEAIVAMVECNPGKVGWGASHGCTSAAGMEQDFVAAGFDITRLDDSLSEDTIHLGRPTTGTVRRDPATQGPSGAPRPARRYRRHRSGSS